MPREAAVEESRAWVAGVTHIANGANGIKEGLEFDGPTRLLPDWGQSR
jgi:hypothetical protein